MVVLLVLLYLVVGIVVGAVCCKFLEITDIHSETAPAAAGIVLLWPMAVVFMLFVISAYVAIWLSKKF